eukprot:Platyproteum_vivax@DN4675_c0_g1_i1.p1
MGAACLKEEKASERKERKGGKSAALITNIKPSILTAGRILSKPISDDYTISGTVLGSGFSGPVRLVKHRRTGVECAVKVFNKKGGKPEKIEMLRNEALIYLTLDHPNIARLLEVYEDDDQVWMVMEKCEGGELYDRLQEKTRYSENDTIEVTKQMLEALAYLHTHNVVHRDLKLENWLYATKEASSSLKLIDFGFSKVWNPTTRMQASCGSLYYVSPDTLSQNYTNACDMWSLGVIVYMLLVGYPPFYGDTEDIVMDQIMAANFSVEGPRWHTVSASAKNFVCSLLEINPQKRLTARQALKHEWISSSSDDVQIDLEVLHSMKLFAQSAHFKRAALTLMAFSLTSEQIDDVQVQFKAFDKSLEGTIRLEEFASVVQKYFEVPIEEIEQIFNQLDSSGDQQVYYNDFLAAVLTNRLQQHEHLLRLTFQKMDVDNSGVISADNLRQVLGNQYQGAEIEEIISQIDTNQNGTIEYDEFLAAMTDGNNAFTPNKKRNSGMTQKPTILHTIIDREIPAHPSRSITAKKITKAPTNKKAN